MVRGSIPRSARHFLIFFNRQCVRVVKEADLKSVGLCPRRFKSCHCRNLSVAQLVEQRTVVPLVTGSNPVAENSASVRVVKELPLGGNVEKRASSNLVLHIEKLISFFCQLKCKKWYAYSLPQLMRAPKKT